MDIQERAPKSLEFLLELRFMSEVPRELERIGRYRVLRQLGSGGMGVVYAARDPDLDREVAVKLLRPDRMGPGAGEKLRFEAQAAAKLAHPNVVAIHDIGQHDGRVYIAMELVNGPSLQQWVESDARPWREILSMFFQAGMGLAAAHDAGLIHRDFKPGNVLVADRRARVVDFGLARARDLHAVEDGLSGTFPLSLWLDDATLVNQGRTIELQEVTSELQGPSLDPIGETTTTTSNLLVSQPTASNSGVATMELAGTPAYMAPELYIGGQADARSDQFAWCVSLYEALYGERPFTGVTLGELAQAALAGVVASPPSRSRIPIWMRHILLKGLSRDPAARHASMKSMLASIAFTARIMWD